MGDAIMVARICAVCCALLVFLLQCSIVHTAHANLVGYWPLDGNGTAVVGTNGVLNNGPTPAADRNGAAGMALAFNGGLSQFVSIAGGGGFNNASAVSVSMWVNWNGIQDPA
jgi:hypothetical protein